MSKILIIEDCIDIRENMEEFLEMSDFEVLSACNGQEGITLIQEEMPDLILCDISMPIMNGYQVLKFAKSDPFYAHIPFVFTTASAQQKDIEKGKLAGADAYLTKPFSAEKLMAAVEQFLNEEMPVTE